VFASTRGGVRWNLWAIRERLGLCERRAAPVQLTVGPLDFFNPVPSRDGKKLFAVGEQSQGELLAYDAKKRMFFPSFQACLRKRELFAPRRAYPEGSLWHRRDD
jgi:hypothetical protein